MYILARRYTPDSPAAILGKVKFMALLYEVNYLPIGEPNAVINKIHLLQFFQHILGLRLAPQGKESWYSKLEKERDKAA